MSDLIERLRYYAKNHYLPEDILPEAAAEIERLRKTVGQYVLDLAAMQARAETAEMHIEVWRDRAETAEADNKDLMEDHKELYRVRGALEEALARAEKAEAECDNALASICGETLKALEAQARAEKAEGELEIQRDSQVSAVDQMLVAEARAEKAEAEMRRLKNLAAWRPMPRRKIKQ